MRFSNKNAMVTGAGHGIGQAIAARLADENARVLICDIDGARAGDAVAAIRAAGGTAEACVMDVRNRDDVAAGVGRLVELWGRIDIQVSCAGIMDRAPFLEMSDELWHRILDTNLHGAFLCGQITARAMAGGS